jgi:hypothetical protein
MLPWLAVIMTAGACDPATRLRRILFAEKSALQLRSIGKSRPRLAPSAVDDYSSGPLADIVLVRIQAPNRASHAAHIGVSRSGGAAAAPARLLLCLVDHAECFLFVLG